MTRQESPAKLPTKISKNDATYLAPYRYKIHDTKTDSTSQNSDDLLGYRTKDPSLCANSRQDWRHVRETLREVGTECRVLPSCVYTHRAHNEFLRRVSCVLESNAANLN